MDTKPELLEPTKPPSLFQIGNKVKIHFEGFKIDSAKVIRIHFSQSKVSYDLEVYIPNNYSTRIYNVDSALLS